MWFSNIVKKESQKPGQNLCLLCLQYAFVSFLSRDNTYKILMSVCLHLEVGHESQRQQDNFFFFSEANSSLAIEPIDLRQQITILEMLLLAQEKSPCGSPAPSPAELSFRGQRSPLSPRYPLVGQTHLAPLYVEIRILSIINIIVQCRVVFVTACNKVMTATK